MEASAIHASAGLGRSRVLALTTPLLRLRSDQQLVGLFRGGNDDAFRVIHDRYRARLLAYVRQMLAGSNPDAEDVLQDVFVRAFAGLRANGRELSLRPWLYRIAHNRCIDELRRPMPPALDAADVAPAAISDPVLESEKRESLRRLIVDIRRLPDQQRSALLMREMGGMAYTEVAGVLGLSVPAVKSLLVRARLGLAAALDARDTACHEIRAELAAAHDRGVRPSGLARRHLHDCPGCREYRSEVRSVSRQLAALTPALGPVAALARLIGVGSGGGAAAGGTGSGVLAAGGGAASAGTTVFGAAATHVAAVVAAAVVTAGGAVEIQRTVATQIDPAPAHHAKRSVSVGLGTSAEGSVAASAAAPLSSSAPTPVQRSSAPAGHSRQGAQVARPKRSEKAGKGLAAQTTPASPSAAAATGTGTSTPATSGSTTAATNPASCQIPPATGQAPAGTSTTTDSSSTSTLACNPSTAMGTSGTVTSTTPGSSSGPSSSNGTSGPSGAAGIPTPTSGSPVSPQAPDSQAQKS